MTTNSAAANAAAYANIVSDVRTRRRGNAHIIVFANEKGGVGKSTLAFHAAVALANAGASVLTVDCDARQRSLYTALENRRATMTCLGVALPCPRAAVVERPGAVALLHEMARLGSDCRFILIDTPGHDSPAGRSAVALADTLVTPVNPSFVDLAHLGRFNPATMDVTAPGPFGSLVSRLQQERVRQGHAPADWLLLKNRARHSEMRQQERVDQAIAMLAHHLGARVGSGFSERVGYRELFVFGLTHPDIARIPQVGAFKARDTNEVERMLAELRLPPVGITNRWRDAPHARVLAHTRAGYLDALKAHVAPHTGGTRARA